eukprot:3632310-Amphidinium_carterae.1
MERSAPSRCQVRSMTSSGPPAHATPHCSAFHTVQHGSAIHIRVVPASEEDSTIKKKTLTKQKTTKEDDSSKGAPMDLLLFQQLHHFLWWFCIKGTTRAMVPCGSS